MQEQENNVRVLPGFKPFITQYTVVMTVFQLWSYGTIWPPLIQTQRSTTGHHTYIFPCLNPRKFDTQDQQINKRCRFNKTHVKHKMWSKPAIAYPMKRNITAKWQTQRQASLGLLKTSLLKILSISTAGSLAPVWVFFILFDIRKYSCCFVN